MIALQGRLLQAQKAGALLMPQVLEKPREAVELVGGMLVRDKPCGAGVTAHDVVRLPPGTLLLLTDLSDLEPLVQLDARVYAEAGMTYAAEPWTVANFAHPLPKKSVLSFAFMDGQQVVGFWIGSERVAGEAHTHRVAVEAAWRQRHVGRHLFAAFWRAAASFRHVTRMTVEVGLSNTRAQRFYMRLGYHAVDAETTQAYLTSRGREDHRAGREIVAANGARSIVMARRI